jgi:inorganic pyrophosphatase
MLLEISHFFATYKDLEGKRAIVSGWQNVDKARKVIEESHARYNASKAK